MRGSPRSPRRALPATGAAIEKQGALFDVDRSLAKARPPAGDYRCRMFKLGGKGSASPDFTAYSTFACRIDDEGEVAGFYKVGRVAAPGRAGGSKIVAGVRCFLAR